MTGRTLVNELLEDGGVEHGETSDDEAESDTLDGGEVDLPATEERVDTEIQDRDDDDDGDGVQVLDEIVRGTVEGHRGSDCAQVSVDLGVA